MTRTSPYLLLAVTAALATACASDPAPGTTVPGPAVSRTAADSGTAQQAGAAPRRSRNSSVITAAELADPSLASIDLLSVVERLRPNFLTSRGAVNFGGRSGGVMVSIDRGVLMGLETLRSMRAGEVKEVRYLSPADAAQQFGTKSASGAVLMVSRR